jgi:hypothetical protein
VVHRAVEERPEFKISEGRREMVHILVEIGAKGEVGKSVRESVNWFIEELPKGKVSESIGEKISISPTELTPQDKVGEGARERGYLAVIIEDGKISEWGRERV